LRNGANMYEDAEEEANPESEKDECGEGDF
jgi:hypothetical protein